MAMFMTQKTEPMRVDSHQHFWRYNQEEFGWINDQMAVIRRDFLPDDLAPLLHETKIDAAVSVQASQTIEETEFLLGFADQHAWIAGVVGWVPLISPQLDEELDRQAANKKLKGIRHILQAEADEYMQRDDFNAGIARLQDYSLTYDVLILERQLPAAIQFVDRHPAQPFVLDHVAKPRIVEHRIAGHQIEPWRTQIRELARRPHVVCKLSGMVTEADFNSWTVADLCPYVETVLEAFGPGRLLFGSDWPVCTVAASYGRWVSTVTEYLSELSTDELQMIFGENATKFYKL